MNLRDQPADITMGMKPIKNPPVGPKIIPTPPLKEAKTGTPITPSSKYASVQTVPFLIPRTNPANNIAKVCNVNGIPHTVGIEINEKHTITATMSAQYTIERVRDFGMPFSKLCKELLIIMYPWDSILGIRALGTDTKQLPQRRLLTHLLRSCRQLWSLAL